MVLNYDCNDGFVLILQNYVDFKRWGWVELGWWWPNGNEMMHDFGLCLELGIMIVSYGFELRF